jgi:hypothetical protein
MWRPCEVAFALLAFSSLFDSVLLPKAVAQIPQTGNIAGQVQISRGSFPPEAILITLETRGAMVGRIYADNEGRFGFYDLQPNPYHIIINEKKYLPVDEIVVVNPIIAHTNIVHITLTPLESSGNKIQGQTVSGSNPYLTSASSYENPSKSSKRVWGPTSTARGKKPSGTTRRPLAWHPSSTLRVIISGPLT